MGPVSIKLTDAGFPVGSETIVKPLCYAKAQFEYLPLLSVRLPDGRVVSRWRLSREECAALVGGTDIFLTLHTFGFGQPLQPIQLTVGPVDYLVRSESSYSGPR